MLSAAYWLKNHHFAVLMERLLLEKAIQSQIGDTNRDSGTILHGYRTFPIQAHHV